MMIFENHLPLTGYDFQPILVEHLQDNNPMVLSDVHWQQQ